MNAYDYEAQRYVTGREGAALAARQIAEEIELYEGPQAAEYLRFVGSKQTVDAVLSSLRTNLALAQAEVLS